MLALLVVALMGQNTATMAGLPPMVYGPPADIATYLSTISEECPAAHPNMTTGQVITHSRASGGAYCTKVADGTLVWLESGVARVNSYGIQIESGRTNFIIRSEEFDNAAWTKSDVTVTANSTAAPDGTTEMDTLESTVSGGYVESTAWVPSVTSGIGSVYCNTSAGTQAIALRVRDTTAGVDRATTTPTITTTTTRVTVGWTGGTGANNHVLRIYPGGTGGTGTVRCWGTQAEGSVSSFLTSYIPTAGAAAVRNAENISFPPGTAVDASGCVTMSVTFGPATFWGESSLLGNGTENMVGLNDVTTMRMKDGTNTVDRAVASIAGRTFTVRGTWGSSAMSLTADGSNTVGSFDGSFSTTATLRLGSTAANTSTFNGFIKNFRLGPSPAGCQ